MSQKIMHSGAVQTRELGDVIATVVKDNGAKWYRFVMRLLRNEADAEDVLQEAIFRVLDRNSVEPSEDQVRKYLGRAITNTAIEVYYGRKRDRLRNVALFEDMVPEENSTTPLAQLEEIERHARKVLMVRALSEGLTRLPPKQYEAVRMTVLEPGITSIRDAGAVNGIAYSTLRHRTVQGLLRLRKFIRQALRSSPEW